MSEVRITTPLTEEVIADLQAGQKVLISGTVYTARDAAHKRLVELLNAGKELPFDVRNQIIYYAGPAPTKPGRVIGSAGPTTSGRMDAYTPQLLDLGLKGMIGKGIRTPEVIQSLQKNKAVYFAAVGGAAALIAKKITSCEVIAYPDLGPEAIHKLEVKDLPVIVVNDIYGRDLYREVQASPNKQPVQDSGVTGLL